MKQLKRLLLLLPLLTLAAFAFSQNKEITGKVIDLATGQPLEGVSVLSDNKKVGTSTKQNGTYALTVNDGTKVLLFSFVGYLTQSVSIAKKESINVSLVSEASVQSEVVVIGYGTQKKANVTGAVAKYKNDRLDEVPVSRVDQALQGKIAGVNVQNISSEAGAEPKISIRGTSSINAGATPLVVIDGQITPDGLGFINPADVESIEVLKDAASSAIYGSRGSSGVILVTTKKGTADKPKYSFKYSIGRRTAYKRYDIMSTEEYVGLLFDEMAKRANDSTVNQATNTVTAADRASYIIADSLLQGSTDWQDESLSPAMLQNFQLGVSGGSKSIKYYFSAGYQGEDGMMYKSNYEKFNVRAKLDVDLSKKVKLILNLNPSYARRQTPSQNFTNFWRMPGWLPVRHNEASAAFVRQNAQFSTIKAGDYAHQRHFAGLPYSGTMPDGSFYSTTSANPGGSAQQNPKSEVDRTEINVNEYRLQSSAEFNVNILPGLSFKSLGSGYLNYNNGLDFSQRSANRDGDVNIGVFTNNSNIYLLWENTLNYSKSFGNHDISAVFGATTERTNVKRQQTTGLDFPSDDIRNLSSAAQIDKNRTTGTESIIGLNSFLGRATYAFKSKYLLSASLRTDGSSYFGPGNKWGTFPAVSAGWVASKENFLANVKWLSNLKFRGSYGATGNNRIVADAWLDLLYGLNYPYGGANGSSNAGLVTSSAILANPDITWERTFQTNLGVDLGLFSNKIGVSVDVYQSKTEKLLLQQSIMGFTGAQQYWNNLGSLQNNGFEIELTSRNIQNNNFRWTTSANLSRNNNEILELGGEAFLLNQGERAEVYRNQVGRPLVEYLGFKTDGVWLSQAQIDAERAKGLTSTLSGAFAPGGLKIVDINGDNKLDNADRTIIGDPYADFIWAMTNNFSYKGFELSFMLQGSQGGEIVNGDPNYNESGRTMRVYNQDRWVSAKYPGNGVTPASRGVGFNWMLTDYVVEDASYWSLREVQFSYAFKADLIKKLKLNGLRLYLSAQNVYFHTASNYRGLNPEGRFRNGPYGSVLIDGYQRGGFPIPKSFFAGIDINF